MWDRRDVGDRAHLQTRRLHGANGRLSTGAGAFDEHVNLSQAMVGTNASRRCPGDLSGVGRTFPGAFEAGSAAAEPTHGIAVRVGDGDHGVIKGGVNIGTPIRNIFSLPARAA